MLHRAPTVSSLVGSACRFGFSVIGAGFKQCRRHKTDRTGGCMSSQNQKSCVPPCMYILFFRPAPWRADICPHTKQTVFGGKTFGIAALHERQRRESALARCACLFLSSERQITVLFFRVRSCDHVSAIVNR